MAKFTITPPSGQPVTVEATSREEAMDQLLNASGPDVSALGSFGRGAASTFPLGEQAYAGVAGLAEHKPFLQERQEFNKLAEADKEQNPGARLAGQAAGVVAPIALTAGVAAPETLLGAAGQGAAFGAAGGAGNAIDTLASGGSGEEAAGDVALGAGAGALGGAAGEGVAGLIGKAAGFTAPTAEEFTAGNTARILGGTTRQVRNLPGKNPVSTLNALGDTMRDATVDGEPLVSALDRTPDRLKKFIALNQQSGKSLGDMAKAANAPAMDVNDLISQIKPSEGSFLSPDESAHIAAVVDDVKKYADDTGAIPFDRLRKLKADVGDKAYQGRGNDVLKDVYHKISNAEDAQLDKVGTQINKPAFDLAKKQYQMTSRAIPMLKMAVGKELTNKASLTVPGAALVTGHPIAAGLAFAKPRLEQIANGLAFKAGSTLPGMAADVGSKVASTGGALAAVHQLPSTVAPTDLHLNHPALAPWKAQFDKNAANAKDPGEVSKANAVTDFTLSQRDPAYAKAKQHASENPEQPATPTPSSDERQNMAAGGVVSDAIDKLENFQGIPDSTLEGFEGAVKKNQGEPFNSSMKDKLTALLAKRKEKADAE